MDTMETQIGEWRSFVGRSPAMNGHDVEELETHLREQMSELQSVGLTPDEAFLVAVKRMGSLDDLSHEFAREHSGRLWKQLVVSGTDTVEGGRRSWASMLGFSVAAALTVVIALLIAGYPDATADWPVRNVGFLVLPFVAAWFVESRRVPLRPAMYLIGWFAVAAVVVNVYPWASGSSSEVLAAVHLPVLLWFGVGVAHARGEVRSGEQRMDFVRFTGEMAIYYALIALGGGVLLGLTAAILEPAGMNAERIIEWVLPAGATGAVVVAAWLVESKKHVVENMAPVLTMIFTPLFAVMLTVAAVVYATTGLGSTFDRELLSVFDVLMVVVLGLVLYSMSARPPAAPPGWMDRIQLVAVVGALALDVMVLISMIARIGDLGFTPNRVAALGLNVVLLVNLTVTAWLSARFLRSKGTFHRIERWQTGYLPVFAVWAAFVVVVLPLVSSFG